MVQIFVVIIILISYGSLYPFDFQWTTLDSERTTAFLASWNLISSRGDIVSNLVLFVPYGLVGMFAIKPSKSAGSRMCLVILSGTVLGFSLQVGQLYLPGRAPEIQDGLWNLLGIVVGAVIALPKQVKFFIKRVEQNLVLSFPLLLCGAWIAYLLIPFVPTIDFQAVKTSIKPLLFQREWNYVEIFHYTIGWLVYARLWGPATQGRFSDWYLWALIPAVPIVQLFIYDNVVTFAEVVGGICALLIWTVMSRPMIGRATTLSILLGISLFVDALWPFDFQGISTKFQWLPFSGFLEGSMLTNAAVLCKKAFFYGALLYMLHAARISLRTATIFSAIFIFMLELAQTKIGHHTPEITDSLLVLMIAFFMRRPTLKPTQIHPKQFRPGPPPKNRHG